METQPQVLGYKVEDACRAIGCGRTKLYALLAEGELEAVALGSRTIITAASLRRFFDNLPSLHIGAGRSAAKTPSDSSIA
jgi:excisionase family DNA binding protein